MCTRKWFAAMVLVLVGASGFSRRADAVPTVYNFDGLAAGTIVRGVEPGGGFLAGDPYPDFDLSVAATHATNSQGSDHPREPH